MTVTPRTHPVGGPGATVTCQGGYVGGSQVRGLWGADTGNRSQSLLPAALGISALPPCWGVQCLRCPDSPPGHWALGQPYPT
jgi:hypothetical protein